MMTSVEADGFRELADTDGVSITHDTVSGLLAFRFHRRGVVVLLSRQDASDLEAAIQAMAEAVALDA